MWTYDLKFTSTLGIYQASLFMPQAPWSWVCNQAVSLTNTSLALTACELLQLACRGCSNHFTNYSQMHVEEAMRSHSLMGNKVDSCQADFMSIEVQWDLIQNRKLNTGPGMISSIAIKCYNVNACHVVEGFFSVHDCYNKFWVLVLVDWRKWLGASKASLWIAALI